MENGRQSPFEGQPTTTKITDDKGRTNYKVDIQAMTPLRARIADWLSTTASILTFGGGVFIAFNLSEPDTAKVFALLAAPIPAYFIAKGALYEVMQKTVSVMFTPDEFTVSTAFGTKRFDRNMPHKFTLYVHDKAQREEEVLSYRESKRQHHWWAWKLKRYFGRSYHLSFDYLDQRNVLLTIYKRKTAHKILTRLNAVRQVMDNQTNQGAGQALSPEEDWSQQAGGLKTNLNSGSI